MGLSSSQHWALEREILVVASVQALIASCHVDSLRTRDQTCVSTIGDGCIPSSSGRCIVLSINASFLVGNVTSSGSSNGNRDDDNSSSQQPLWALLY